MALRMEPSTGRRAVRWQPVPEAVKVVISSGVALHDLKGFSSSLRLRYFGPRPLSSDGLYQSSQTVLLNGELGYQFNKKWHVTAEFLNMLNRKDADIDYAYSYQILRQPRRHSDVSTTPPNRSCCDSRLVETSDKSRTMSAVQQESGREQLLTATFLSCFRSILVRMRVFVYLVRGCGQRLRGNRHDQTPMLDSFQRDQLAGELLHRRRTAMHNQHLQAGVVIQMRVAGGDNQFVMLMLQLGQLLAHAVRIVVIDQGDGAHDNAAKVISD